MSWPCNESIWAEGLPPAADAYSRAARAIAKFEPVVVLVRETDRSEAQSLCGDTNITYITAELDDSWIRDSGPTFVHDVSGRLHGLLWRFDAYGGKYPHERDRKLAGFVCDRAGVPSVPVLLTCEGGAITVDGNGTAICTQTTLLDPLRNVGLSTRDVERALEAYLGVTKVIWLKGGLKDDDTNGHVDEVACLAKPGVVVALSRRERDDPDYEQLSENLDRLRGSSDATGRALQVVTVHAPVPMVMAGRRLSMSYTNYYLANGAVVIPAFGDRKRDAEAFSVLAGLYPERQAVQVDTRSISVGGGNIHCITQQEPR
jgi:agmatine deiminase